MIGVEHWPEIISRAAQSRAGLVALGLLLLGGALKILFGRAGDPPWARLLAFAMIIAGGAWFIRLTVAEAQRTEPVSQKFEGDDRDGDCDINRTKTHEHCLLDGSNVTSWDGPTPTTANCGSGIAGITATSGKPNCVTVTTILRGCGYGIVHDCKGTGWIHYTVNIHGDRPAHSP
jgi:hypothetical protein